MTLTKAKITESIRSLNGQSEKHSAELVESIIGIIKDTLASGEDVMISGCGKFCVRDKKQRNGGRNFVTGEDLVLRPRRVVTFRCSGKLRERINDG